MEATATPYSNGTTAETSPPLEDARDNNSNEPAPTTGTDTATAPKTQSHFESRGSLDTLVAAALKPLAAVEDYPQRHHSPPQRYDSPGHNHSIRNNANNHTRGTDSSISNESLNDRNQHGSSTPHIPHHKESPSRSSHHADNSSATGSSGLDPSRLQTTSSSSEAVETTTTTTTHSRHEHPSSKYHYREQGRGISDEDSEEDPSPASRQHNHHTRLEPPSVYPSRPSHGLQEQSESAFKSNARSSMSISSLLGDSSGYARRTTGDEDDSTPDHHATARHLTSSPVVRPSGAQSEGLFEQRCTERVAKRDNCPRRQSDARDELEGHEDMDQDHLSCEPHPHYHHHGRLHSHPHSYPSHPIRHHHHHRPSEDQITGAILPDAAKLQGQHHHQHQEASVLVNTVSRHHHHHRHIPHQHQHHSMGAHSHNHPHVHHHPQHLGLQGPQHAKHPHHHHHHIHHHHLHIEKSPSSAPSAFHYVPRSAGLSLNPRLKVNATQVYISYLIQLDQMQRAQHLKRSSEKRKSTGDMVNGLAGSPTTQRPPHARTPSVEESGRSVQVVPHPEELADRDREDRAYSPGMAESPEDRKRRSSFKPDETEATTASMYKAEALAPVAVDPPSNPVSSRSQHSHGHPHPHLHSHPHPHPHHPAQSQPPPPHAHAHSHSHPHPHPHPHPYPHPSHGHQHSAPVLPAHVHPAQHHHHIVPSPVRGEKAPISAAAATASAKANHSQTVHRHHALHHHHPHHHPYHPNHPNHQHHFHHHGHPGAHNHGHGHGHGHGHPYHGHGHMHLNHVHNHGNHIHPHGHGRSPSRQRSPTVDRMSRDSATPPISRLPHVAQPIAHPTMPASSASPKSTAGSSTVVPGATLVVSESYHHGGEDRRASSPCVARHDRGGAVSPAHGARGYENVARTESIKDAPLEMDNAVHENSSAPPPSTTPAATPVLETAMNVD